MVGLGTIFMAVMLISGIQLWRKKLYETKWLLWILMLSCPAALYRQYRRLDDG